MPQAAEAKRGVLQTLLEHGVVMLHLDARREGVVVPAHLRGEEHLRLNVSLDYNLPVFDVEDWGLRASLSFGGERFVCELPWPAVFGLTSQQSERGWVWPEDLPPELRDFAAPGGEVGAEAGSGAAPRGPQLTLVGGEGETAESSPRRGGHLRLVK